MRYSMKIKNIIVPVFITLILSCYMEPESSGGAVSIRLQSDVMRAAPEGYDGELKLRFFSDGDLDSLVEYSGGGASPTVVGYLGTFPSPLGVGINSTVTVPFIYENRTLSVQNVPSDKKLNVLVELYTDEYYNGDYYYYYMPYAGLSESFEVEGGGTAEVTVTLYETASGTIAVDVSDTDFSQVYIRIFEPEILDSYVTITESTIEYDIESYQEIDSYGSEGIQYPELIEMMPGKNLKILVSENSYPETGDLIGISGTFVLQPGRTLSVPVTYYSYYTLPIPQ